MSVGKTTENESAIERKGPMPPAYLFAAIAVMVALHFLLPGMKLLPFPWNLLGVGFLGIGVALNLVADKAFKKRQTTVKPFEEPSTLITDGVYNITRNPMYLGFVLVLLGIGVCMGSLVPFAVVPVFAVLIDVVFVRVEERMLENTFGGEWADYRNRVRRWI